MGLLEIPPSYLEKMKAQAERDYPNETCGILVGPKAAPNQIAGFFPCRNVQDEYHALDPVSFPRTAQTAYFMDPENLLSLQRESRQKGEEVRVIYHSHNDAGAYFSEEDERIALSGGKPVYPGVAYVVISVMKGKTGEIRLFQWDANQRSFVGRSLGREGADQNKS